MCDGNKNCGTCAWYCHSNGMCYGNDMMLAGIEAGTPMDEKHEACGHWAFDGLEEWEREAFRPEAVLMTMEEACCI